MKKITLILAGLLIGSFSISADAAKVKNPHVVKAHSWTFGVAGAQNRARILDFGKISSGSTEKDLCGSAIRVMGEYNFKRWFAVGLGYDYLNSGEIRFNNGQKDIKIRSHIAELYGKFSTNISGVELFAKAGPMVSFTKFDGVKSGDDSSTTIGGVLGAGVSYRFSNGVGIRGGYDYFLNTGKITNPEKGKSSYMTSGLLYLGLTYNFK